MEHARPKTSQLVLAAAGCAGTTTWFFAAGDERVLDPLTALLALGAVVANLRSVQTGRGQWVSATLTCWIVAIAVLGPAAAFAVVVAGEIGAWVVERIRLYAVVVNILAAGIPTLLAAEIFRKIYPVGYDIDPDADAAVALLSTLAGVSLLPLFGSYVITSLLGAPTLRDGLRASRRLPRGVLPPLLWSVPVGGVVASLWTKFPTIGLLAVVLAVLGVTYMLQLVAATRSSRVERSLAGHDVVAGMLRALRQRDPESARHAGAVANFSSSIASALGLCDESCRDAHTAGLLHDLGRLGLSDVALRADGPLTEREWQAIQHHPAVGADVLRSLGLPAAVADAVGAHHERVDGRGYPNGLGGEAIPLLARIVAVAEVYDTLTAGTTYRPRGSSFQALTELRRVSGTQLDPSCVEALATVLADRPFADRHATAVDLDAELERERRIVRAAVH